MAKKNEEQKGYCVKCGAKKDVDTVSCVECLHKDRIAHAIRNGCEWAQYLK